VAVKIAEYKFTDYEEWTSAKNRLYSECGGSSYVNWDCPSYSDPWYIYIYDECRDAALAGKICRVHGGTPCNP
jgi:hypothetical protein